jgi:hypothetical protein
MCVEVMTTLVRTAPVPPMAMLLKIIAASVMITQPMTVYKTAMEIGEVMQNWMIVEFVVVLQ